MKNSTSQKKALIYCRVSHTKQKNVGGGLDSQELRCRQYAAAKGYKVTEVFPDDVTGGGDFMNRPGMVALLYYLKHHPEDNYVVIFDDLKRFARDTVFHWNLRNELTRYNASLECLNFRFEDTPEGVFVETIFAAQGQLEREQNRRQTIQKMKACLERGHYPFQPPVGYERVPIRGRGKVLQPIEPAASVVKECLESYACGRFETQGEIRAYLQNHPDFPKGRTGYVAHQRVRDILERCFYAGYLEKKDWGVSFRKANHPALISLETYQKIQDRLNGKRPLAPVKKVIHQDFKLRGAIDCADCGSPMTGSWSTGRSRKYPYYFCCNRQCASFKVHTRREVLEGAFDDFIQKLTPHPQVIKVAKAMFDDIWSLRMEYQKKLKASLYLELDKLNNKVEGLLERVLEAQTSSVVRAYEDRIQKLEQEKLVIQEKINESYLPAIPYEETLRTALRFLANPYQLWVQKGRENSIAVLRLVFSERPKWKTGEGIRTAKTTLPFNKLGDFQKDFAGNFKMVRSGGFEPPTTWFVARYSIQLSYERTSEKQNTIGFIQ